MPKYRAVIERTVVSRETVEFTTDNIVAAARKANEIANDRSKRTQRGVQIVRTFADDPTAATRDDVVSVIERP